MEIKKLEKSHWESVERIYKSGIIGGHATFETNTPGWENWDKSHLPNCRWIAFDDQKVVGWIALSPVSDRCVYEGVAEVSVYIDQHYKGKNIGSLLMEKVIESSESAGIWTLTAAMFPENEASVRLHEKCGFRRIGYREKVGKLLGEWRDTFLYERRSKTII